MSKVKNTEKVEVLKNKPLTELTDRQIYEDARQHKVSSKFGSSLDALFSADEDIVTVAANDSESVKRKRGIDYLFRSTMGRKIMGMLSEEDQKRVTFLYSRSQLEKVRKISKAEAVYMKDIIGEAVNQWIESYETDIQPVV